MTHTGNNESAGGPFTVGELVDVTIRGARVEGLVSRKPWARLIDLTVSDTWHPVIDLDAPGVTVARVAPTEWPPQPADVWSDKDGGTWATLGNSETGRVEMYRTADRRDRWSDPQDVLDGFGPMRLEYRPGWTRQPDPVPAGPADGEPEIRTPEEWCATLGIKVVDPDGWRGQNARSWNDPISRDEFDRRAAYSTVHGWSAPTVILPTVPPLPGVGAQPVDDPVQESDGRCWVTTPDVTKPNGRHFCERYGPHVGVNHRCVCDFEWPDVPAPRDAAE